MLILYTKTVCPWCIEVRDFLLENKVVFEERNVVEDPLFMEEMISKSNQTKAPTLDLDGKILADAGEDEVREFLKIEGVI